MDGWFPCIGWDMFLEEIYIGLVKASCIDREIHIISDSNDEHFFCYLSLEEIGNMVHNGEFVKVEFMVIFDGVYC